MELVLHALKEKEINTSRGKSKIFNFKSGDIWYSAFKGSWNAGWQEGMTIDIPDDRIKAVQNGQYVNHRIQAPPKAERDAQKAADMQRALSGIEAIWKDLQLIKKHLGMVTK